MRKKIAFIFICFYMATAISAKEPLLAILNSAISNDIQKFGIGNYTFECKAYGVLTLETLYNNSKKTQYASRP